MPAVRDCLLYVNVLIHNLDFHLVSTYIVQLNFMKLRSLLCEKVVFKLSSSIF